MIVMIKILEMELMMVIFMMKNMAALKIIETLTGIIVTDLMIAFYDNFDVTNDAKDDDDTGSVIDMEKLIMRMMIIYSFDDNDDATVINAEKRVVSDMIKKLEKFLLVMTLMVVLVYVLTAMTVITLRLKQEMKMLLIIMLAMITLVIIKNTSK